MRAAGGSGATAADSMDTDGPTQQQQQPPLAPAERAAARACVDGLKCMALMLQQHEAAVGVLLREMEAGGGEGGGSETLRALAGLAGGLYKVLPGGDAGVKRLLVANLAKDARQRAEEARRGGLDLFPCRTQVLSDRHLVAQIVSNFVRLPGDPTAPPPAPDAPPQDGLRRTLNTLSRVSRLWCQVARKEEFWKPICQQLLPVCAEEDAGALLKELKVQGGYYGLIRDFGRCFIESRLYMDDEDWFTDLLMNIEVYDNRDNFLFFSACGPVALTEEAPHDGQDEDEHREPKEFRLSMAGKNRKEIVGPPFSAHSRDPDKQFESAADFFRGCHAETCQAALTVRITVKDKRTGKMGVLWNTGDGLPLHVDQFYEESGSEEDGIPQGALTVATKEWAKLHSLSPTFVTHDFDMHHIPEDEEDTNADKPKLCQSLWASVGFMVNPVANQPPDTPEADKLWVFAGGDEENYERFVSFTHILFSASRVEEVGRFVRSLLV